MKLGRPKASGEPFAIASEAWPTTSARKRPRATVLGERPNWRALGLALGPIYQIKYLHSNIKEDREIEHAREHQHGDHLVVRDVAGDRRKKDRGKGRDDGGDNVRLPGNLTNRRPLGSHLFQL